MMLYSNFRQKINEITRGTSFVTEASCYGHLIQVSESGDVFIDGNETKFSLEEARDHIKQNILREQLEQEIQQEQYKKFSITDIVDIIKEYHSNIKITDSLIESYIELASSKLFTSDPVANQIRNTNKLDRLIETHVDFVLKDGTTIVISENTQTLINNIFGNHSDVIEYMRENKDHFLSVLQQIEVD